MITLEEPSMGCRFLHCQNWMETSGSGDNVCIYFTRSAKPANCCLPHIFYGKSLYVSRTFAVLAGSRTSAKESTWDVPWPSNTSSPGQMTRRTIFSRYLSCILPNNLSLLSFHIAILPGNHRLEESISPQHLAFIGCFFLRGSPVFLYRLLLDAKRECDGIHQVQSRGKPFAVGKPTRCFLADSDLTILNDLQLCGIMSGTTYLHDLGIVHGDLKGVPSVIRNRIFILLTG